MKLTQIGDDLQAGVSISGSLARHPDVFSDFYINMVKAGEETGKLNQTFLHLADYLDRQYALTTKTRNALIYPALLDTGATC
jgi:type II secretory pathway component PulF